MAFGNLIWENPIENSNYSKLMKILYLIELLFHRLKGLISIAKDDHMYALQGYIYIKVIKGR